MKWRDLVLALVMVTLAILVFYPKPVMTAPRSHSPSPALALKPLPKPEPGAPTRRKVRPRGQGPYEKEPVLKIVRVSGSSLEDMVFEIELSSTRSLPKEADPGLMIQLHRDRYYWNLGQPGVVYLAGKSDTVAALRWKVKLSELELDPGLRSKKLLLENWGPNLVANACLRVHYPDGNPVARAPNPVRIWSGAVELSKAR